MKTKFYYSKTQAIAIADLHYFSACDEPFIRSFVNGKEFTSRENLTQFNDMILVSDTEDEINEVTYQELDLFDYIEGLQSEFCFESYEDSCIRFGLDSDNTSIHDVECAKLGLPIGKTSIHDVECAKLGLPIGKTSIHDVECVKLGLPIGKTSTYDVELEKSRRKILLN